MIVCNTPTSSTGFTISDALIFRIQQGNILSASTNLPCHGCMSCNNIIGGYVVYGSDTFRYPSAPIVTGIWGCNNQNFTSTTSSTTGCHTRGIGTTEIVPETIKLTSCIMYDLCPDAK
jgi:hypothetical protein